MFERLIYSHSVDLECSRVSEALDVVRHSDEFTPMSGRVDKYLPSYLFRFMLTMEYFHVHKLKHPRHVKAHFVTPHLHVYHFQHIITSFLCL